MTAITTAINIPAGLTVVGPSRGGVEAVRVDGLRVFLDGDHVLDHVRATGTREQVIAAVALRAAQRIALGYARKHAPDLAASFERPVRTVFAAVAPGLTDRQDHAPRQVSAPQVRCSSCRTSLQGTPVNRVEGELIAWCSRCGAGELLDLSQTELDQPLATVEQE